jgi:hypothetical protein
MASAPTVLLPKTLPKVATAVMSQFFIESVMAVAPAPNNCANEDPDGNLPQPDKSWANEFAPLNMLKKVEPARTSQAPIGLLNLGAYSNALEKFVTFEVFQPEMSALKYFW